MRVLGEAGRQFATTTNLGKAPYCPFRQRAGVGKKGEGSEKTQSTSAVKSLS